MNESFSEKQDNVFISGDTFEGIVVSEISDAQYHFSIDGAAIDITQKVDHPQSDRICLRFSFQCQRPARFRIDVKIPADCKNAMVTLNDQKLIGYFSPDIPDHPEHYIESGCNSDQTISTLRPGEYQSINFLWRSGDALNFFFYY